MEIIDFKSDKKLLLKSIKLSYEPRIKGERSFKVLEDIYVRLSDGYEICIKEGTVTDLASVPKWLWSLFTPIDEAFLGDLIHDYLWIDKVGQISHFNNSPYLARKFADEERLRWRMKLAPKKEIKNYITHYVIRLIGSPFYTKKWLIPN